MMYIYIYMYIFVSGKLIRLELENSLETIIYILHVH